MLKAISPFIPLVAVLSLAPTATADPNPGVFTDAQFVKSIELHGISNNAGPEGIIAMGHQQCEGMESGRSAGQQLVWNESLGLAYDQCLFLLVRSTQTYCPQYLPAVDAI
jgi:hypothetical protein